MHGDGTVTDAAESLALVAWLTGIACFVFGIYVFNHRAVRLVMGGLIFKLAMSGSVVGFLWWLFLGSRVLPDILFRPMGWGENIISGVQAAGSLAALGAVGAMFYGGYMFLAEVRGMLSE